MSGNDILEYRSDLGTDIVEEENKIIKRTSPFILSRHWSPLAIQRNASKDLFPFVGFQNCCWPSGIPTSNGKRNDGHEVGQRQEKLVWQVDGYRGL